MDQNGYGAGPDVSRFPEGLPEELVFIKGEREPGNNEQYSKDMTAYSTTDGGPTYRFGKNIFRLKTADPTNSLKQLTFGQYHDVHPNFMPDGRIVFTTTRTGIRDEYHGYPANGLATMNADGSDIHVIGYNIVLSGASVRSLVPSAGA